MGSQKSSIEIFLHGNVSIFSFPDQQGNWSLILSIWTCSLSLFFLIDHMYSIVLLALNKLKNLGNCLSKTTAIKNILRGTIISLPEKNNELVSKSLNLCTKPICKLGDATCVVIRFV